MVFSDGCLMRCMFRSDTEVAKQADTDDKLREKLEEIENVEDYLEEKYEEMQNVKDCFIPKGLKEKA